MLLGILILYLLGVCLIFAVGLFADDTPHGRSVPLAWRALGAILWPVVLPCVVAMGIMARRSTAAVEGGPTERNRSQRPSIGQRNGSSQHHQGHARR